MNIRFLKPKGRIPLPLHQKIYLLNLMGCSSSTATGAMQPVLQCDIIKTIKSLCGDKGSFGCFIPKVLLTDDIISIINNGDYDVILQYPQALSQNGGNNSREKKLLGKSFKHKDITLTLESKGAFLEAIKTTDTINGFKMFSTKQGTYNTFSSEILRYREMMTDPDFFTNSTTVRAVTFTPTVIATDKTRSNRYEKADFISFSIRKKGSNLSRLDFILSETCTPVISKIPGTNKYTYLTSNMSAFIKTLITDLHQLHNKGIYHLDIKPDNIVYCNVRYKFIDYGLAVGIPTTVPSAKDKFKEDKFKDYIFKQFNNYRGTLSYLNPIYLMIRFYYENNKKYLFTVNEIQQKYSKIYTIIPSGVQTFLNYYPEYKTDKKTDKGQFNIKLFMDREPRTSLDDEYKFVTHFYRRADWFSLAVTIDELLTNASQMKQSSKDKYIPGIAKLCDITDEDLANPKLDTVLISAFGISTSRGGRRSRSARQ